MYYSFKDETCEYLLKDMLGYKDLGELGRGAQSKVWIGIKDNNTVAIKVAFEETDIVKAENDLKSHMPDYLKSKTKVSDIFNDNNNLKKIEHYYKYMIVYNSTMINNEADFVKVLNKDFKNKEWDLSIEDIYNFANEISQNTEISNLKKLSDFFQENHSSAVRKAFRISFQKRISQQDTVELYDLCCNLDKLKIYVLTGAVADKDLAAYIQDLQKSKEFTDDLIHILVEVRKLAKHILKGLIALHKSNRAACDIHPGNVVVTNVTRLDGKTSRIKYQLIDFGSSQELTNENSEELIKDDLYRLGYALLIPVFWSLNGEKLAQVPQENNYLTLGKIRGKLSRIGRLGDDFVSFLEKLRDKRFVSPTTALKDSFLR